MESPDLYNIELHNSNTVYNCYINGFPVALKEANSRISLPVHLFLVGAQNSLKIEASQKGEQPGTLNAMIVPYKRGGITGLNSEKDAIASLNIDCDGSHTSEEIVFDNNNFDFSSTLLQAEEMTKTEVKVYGEFLQELVNSQSLNEFIDEMQIKIRDQAKAYAAFGDTEEDVKKEFTQILKTVFFKEKESTIKELSATSYCNDRVWELLLDNKEFLFKEVEEGFYQKVSIFVAKTNGKIHVVR